MTDRKKPRPAELTHRERETISEVLEFCGLTPEQEKTAWAAIDLRWHETSGRFYAYNVAHEIAAAVLNTKPEATPEPDDEVQALAPNR